MASSRLGSGTEAITVLDHSANSPKPYILLFMVIFTLTIVYTIQKMPFWFLHFDANNEAHFFASVIPSTLYRLIERFVYKLCL